jgi:serine/threonine protein kinase/predicted hydrocarbon binding protein
MAAERLSTTASLVGQTLGRYHIVSRLATGGMAELWVAVVPTRAGGRGKPSNRKIVLKTMLPELADAPDFVRMFQTEAAIGARLKHPNLVGIIDYGRLSDRFFIAMEHVDGLNLRQLVRRLQTQARPLPRRALLSIIIDVCRGLDSAHHLRDRQGPLQFVHRDVSPENIMVTRAGAAKLIDFGAARTARLSSSASRFVGKLSYVAPERLNGVGEDLRCDVYSVGVVLYEALTGAKPFEGPEESMIARIVAGQLTRPDRLVTGLPEKLVGVVMRALARRPADRYPRASALADDLQDVRDSLSDSASNSLSVAMNAGRVSSDAVLPDEAFDEIPALVPEVKTASISEDVLDGMLRETREEATVVRDLPVAAMREAAGAPAAARAPVVVAAAGAFSAVTPVPMSAIGPPPCAQATVASSWVFERRRRPAATGTTGSAGSAGTTIEEWLHFDGRALATAPAVQMKLDIASALELARPTLGRGAGLALYRVLRQVALEDSRGRDGDAVCQAGKKLGHSLGLTTLEDFLSLCGSLKIGIIRMPVMTDARIHIDIYECATCSGLARHPGGCAMCQFEGGLIAGVLERVVRRNTRVQEVSCIGGLGDEACGFDLEFGEG